MSGPRALATIGSALCATSAQLDAWSRCFTLAALAALALPLSPPLFPLWPLLAAAGGLLQLGSALRLGFDRPVFTAWATDPQATTPERLAAFDNALQQAGLRDTLPERDLGQRLDGLRRHFRRQVAAFVFQLVAIAATAIALILR